MKKNNIIILLCVLVATVCQAQTNLELADASYNNKDYTEAIGLYQKVLKKPTKQTPIADIKYKVAESYRYTGKYTEALDYYEQAKTDGYSNPNYLYQEGMIYLKQANYAKAEEKFNAFLALQPNDKDATRQLNNIKFIQTATQEPVFHTVSNVTSLNTIYNDYAAAPVGNTVTFTSSRLEDKAQVYSFDGQGFTDIYQAIYNKEGKTWEKALLLASLSTPVNEGELSYSPVTKTAYFTRGNDAKSKDKKKLNLLSIMETSYDEATNSWSAPKFIELSNPQVADMGQPSVSISGDKLYFVSKMEGSLGGNDIWMMQKSGNTWGTPVNLGVTINTDGDEMFPVATDSVLYFASDGHPGYGALDIFASTITNGTYNKPSNLKQPFNSSADDFYLTYNIDKTSGYFTSNRVGGAGGDDIYNFFLTPVNLTVKGRITDQDNGQPIAGVQVVLTTATGSDTAYTNANGDYTFNLDKDKDYKINVLTPGYFGDSRKLSTQGEKFSKEFSKATGNNYDFAIKRIPKEEIKIEDIYYDYDSYNLREESKPSLDKLVKLLEDTPGALVQINSHTDERGKFDYNLKLSENRAKSVVDYLVSKGISAGRLSSKGFASSQPVVKGAKTEEEHQKNRRTTFQVLKND